MFLRKLPFTKIYRLLRCFVILILGLISVGCSLEVGETPRGPVNVANKDMVCVRNLGKGMQQYLEATLSKKGIHDWAACVNDAIYNFDKYTVGEHPTRYSVEEVAKSVSEVVFPETLSLQNLLNLPWW